MPTSVIRFAGIPAPRKFISILPRFPNAGMGQRTTHVNHSWPYTLLLSKIVAGSGARLGVTRRSQQ